MRKISQIKSRKAQIGTSELMFLIIAVILIALVASFLFFKSNILDYLRNLPGYKLPSEDIQINIENNPDLQGGNPFCENRFAFVLGKDGNLFKEAFFGKSQYIHFLDTSGKNAIKSYFYFSGGTERDSLIYSDASDEVVGSLEDGIIKVDQSLFDKSSFIYQKLRSDYLLGYSDINPGNYPLQLVKLDNSYYSLGDLCKLKKDLDREEVDFKDSWPENSNIEFIDISLNELNPLSEKNFFGTTKDVKVNLNNYFDSSVDSISEYYLLKSGNFLEIWGKVNGGRDKKIGIILSDGSIWLNGRYTKEIFLRLDKYEIKVDAKKGISEVHFRLFDTSELTGSLSDSVYYESNLKISDKVFNQFKIILN